MTPAGRAFWLLCLLGVLTLTGLTLPLGAFLSSGFSTAGLSTLLALCVIWFGRADQTVLSTAVCLIVSLLGAGILAGISSLVWQWIHTRRLLATLGNIRSSRPIERCPEWAKRFVQVAETRDVFALSHGFLRPRIVVTRGLLDILTPEELEAVLFHERQHLHAHDPLKLVLARMLAQALFFVPVIPRLAQGYAQAKEVDADCAAMAAQSDGLPMASAFCKVMRSNKHKAAPYAAVGAVSSASEARIAYFTTGELPAWMPSKLAWAASAGLLALEVWVAGAIASTAEMPPMAMAGSSIPGHILVWSTLGCTALAGTILLRGCRGHRIIRARDALA